MGSSFPFMKESLRLILSDFILSVLWVCSGALIKLYVYKWLGYGLGYEGEVVKWCLSVVNMFVFAWLGKVSNGGSYNPLTVLASAISGSFLRFLVAVFGRIPAQVLGSIAGIKLILQTFPEVGSGPRLNVALHHGALTEGLLTFAIITISLGLSRNIPNSFFMKTWISSVSKLALNILGSDLTGGCMNPASVMGWAFARGDHLSKEHLYVYWLAPIEATLLGVWTFKLLAPPVKKQAEEEARKRKSE